RGGVAGDLLVASRRDAFTILRNEVALDGSGLVLLTGESGTGKTWLWRKLTGDLPPLWRWLSVDISSALDGRQFLELVGHGLGVSTGDRLASARLTLARTLEEESAEGRSWILVIENAHNASDEVWTEIETLNHNMEASSGFASLILVGPTELVRLLATRPRRSLASRLCTHIHMLPLDLEECRELAERALGPGQLDRALLEELHRDALGNPRRILQLLARYKKSASARTRSRSVAASRKIPEFLTRQSVATSVPEAGEASGSRAESVSPGLESRDVRPQGVAEPPLAAPLVPSRPPLRVEEGLIEVGWEGNLEADAAPQTEDKIDPVNTATAPPADDPEAYGEETIEDHYAALQAWSEWARNRGRASSSDDPAPGQGAEIASSLGNEAEMEPDEGESRLSVAIRAESEHEHAPYSQLFTKLRQSK
ncbi:MAG: ExeA family protein, partial [Isosphaeraceae bacterium]